MEDEDLYGLLQVSASSSGNEIRKNYQKLAKQYHPDKQSQGVSDAKRTEFTEKFHKVVKAYEILSDPKLRQEYDTKRKASQLSQPWPINATVDLDEMSYDSDGGTYSTGCRCGGSYEISDGDLEEGMDTVCCSTCTLSIKVLYQEMDEAEESVAT